MNGDYRFCVLKLWGFHHIGMNAPRITIFVQSWQPCVTATRADYLT